MCIHGLPLGSGAIPMTSPVIPADFTILARNLLLSGVYCMSFNKFHVTLKKKKKKHNALLQIEDQ